MNYPTTKAALTLRLVSILALPSAAALAADAGDQTIELNPFVVQEQSAEGYISKSATAVGRIAQPLEDIPQQVAIINSALIDEIQPTTFQDILNYDSGVDFSNTEFNGSSPLIRGFSTPSPLRNGVEMGLTGPSQFGNFLGIEAIDQVEIVKGAAAVLYGPSQPGGVINYVTKTPQFTRFGSLEVTAFDQGGAGASLDLTGPAGLKDSTGREELAYRLIVADQGRELYQINDQSLQRQMVYGAVTYQPFKALQIDANYEYDHQKTGFFNSLLLPQAEVTALGNGSLAPAQAPLPYNVYPVNWTYADDGSYADEHDTYAQVDAILHHDFGALGNWTLRINYLWSKTVLFRQIEDVSAGNYPQAVTAANIGQVVNFDETVTAADVSAGRLWIPARYVRQLDTFPTLSLDTQWDLTGVVETGPIKHTVLIGSSQNLGVDFQSGVAGVDQIEKDAYVGAAGDVNAIWVDHPDLRSITNINWNGPLVTSQSNTATGVQYNDSIRFGIPGLTEPKGGNYDKDLYLFDVASMLQDRLVLSGGLRYDDVGEYVSGQEYTNDQWTFRAGGVYKVLPWLQVYALYSGSFLPNSTAASAAFGYFIPPEKGTQDEAGIRLPLFDNKLELDVSAYRIRTTNVVQNNPFGNVGVVPPIPKNNYVFVPGETNNGFDLSAKVNLGGGTQLIGTYSHYDLKQQGGPAQVAVGMSEFPVNNVPSNQAALWLKYTPTFDPFKHFGVDLGYRYIGQRTGGAVGAVPALELNSYDVVDLGLSYSYGRWTFSAMEHNLFNTYAIQEAPATNRLYPVEPRTGTLTARMKF